MMQTPKERWLNDWLAFAGCAAPPPPVFEKQDDCLNYLEECLLVSVAMHAGCMTEATSVTHRGPIREERGVSHPHDPTPADYDRLQERLRKETLRFAGVPEEGDAPCAL